MDWVQRADQFWAVELGVVPRVLRSGGFHVFERAGADPQPRAIVVGTWSAVVVSLPAGRTHAFRTAGLNLREMGRMPRDYVASCSSNEFLEVRGPAYLAYWPPSSPPPSPRGPTQLLAGDSHASLASLRDVAPGEWEEAGIRPESRIFGSLVQDRIAAVAGYERWSSQIAHLQVFCHPDYRRRGLGADALRAAISDALADNLLPQYRARDANVASRALARRIGFVEYGWMATIFTRVLDDAAQQSGARDA